MSKRVITYDHTRWDLVLARRITDHHCLIPLGEQTHAESCVRNLRRNQFVSNITLETTS